MKNSENKKVVFRFFKEAMDVKTEKAQMIKLGNVQKPICVWLPFSQIKVYESKEDSSYNIIELPEWLIYKNPPLAEYIEFYDFEEGIEY